jgi:hypothetical protein
MYEFRHVAITLPNSLTVLSIYLSRLHGLTRRIMKLTHDIENFLESEIPGMIQKIASMNAVASASAGNGNGNDGKNNSDNTSAGAHARTNSGAGVGAGAGDSKTHHISPGTLKIQRKILQTLQEFSGLQLSLHGVRVHLRNVQPQIKQCMSFTQKFRQSVPALNDVVVLYKELCDHDAE